MKALDIWSIAESIRIRKIYFNPLRRLVIGARRDSKQLKHFAYQEDRRLELKLGTTVANKMAQKSKGPQRGRKKELAMLARTEPRKILVVDGEPAAVCGTSAVRAVAKALGHIAMVIAAPIIGLLYILLFPFIGLALSLALLLWMAGEAAVGRVKGLLAAPAPQPA